MVARASTYSIPGSHPFAVEFFFHFETEIDRYAADGHHDIGAQNCPVRRLHCEPVARLGRKSARRDKELLFQFRTGAHFRKQNTLIESVNDWSVLQVK